MKIYDYFKDTDCTFLKAEKGSFPAQRQGFRIKGGGVCLLNREAAQFCRVRRHETPLPLTG